MIFFIFLFITLTYMYPNYLSVCMCRLEFLTCYMLRHTRGRAIYINNNKTLVPKLRFWNYQNLTTKFNIIWLTSTVAAPRTVVGWGTNFGGEWGGRLKIGWQQEEKMSKIFFFLAWYKYYVKSIWKKILKNK